jgi:sec-independent protein translocase protein TatB
MFDIGWSELLVIGVVALVVIGPKELPGVVRMLAQNIGKLRKMAGEFQSQFTDAMREVELSELKKEAEKLVSDTKSTLSFDALDELQKTGAEIQKSLTEPMQSLQSTLTSATEISATETSATEPKPTPSTSTFAETPASKPVGEPPAAGDAKPQQDRGA